jgi:8-oxo-dGTP pyrophosphatase MutT (NUDIX family)
MNAGAEPERLLKLGERSLASTRVLELRSVRFRSLRRATEGDYTVIAAPDWVNVVALTASDRLVLVRQFRYGIDDLSLEIPGGVIEAGEDPISAGQRELGEETGFAGSPARLLGSVHPNPAIQNNRCHLVLVENAELRGDTAWDHDEEIEVSTAPVEEVLEWARTGRITHSLVVCGLFMFERWWAGRRPAPPV